MNYFSLKVSGVVLLGIACIVGCGDGTAMINGKVTYETVPIKEGEIRFLPATGKGPSAAAIITDGHYSVKLAPGEKKVQIFANKVIGTKDIGKIVEIKEQYLPPKFNVQTELTCEITASNATQDFELTAP